MNYLRLFNDLHNELIMRSKLLTEDSVRYYLYSCMLRQDPELNHYIFELPYQELTVPSKYKIYLANPALFKRAKGKLQQELDLYYDDSISDSCCVELKFHRNTPDSSYARTTAAGELFNDLQRLQQLSPTTSSNSNFRKLFVYVTDDIMGRYLSGNTIAGTNGGITNPVANTQLSTFFKPTSFSFPFQLVYKQGDLDSFFKAAFKSFNNTFNNKSNISINLSLLYYDDFYSPFFHAYYHIRVYEVMPNNPPSMQSSSGILR